MVQVVTLPNSKQVLFIGNKAWQRYPNEPWEPIDVRIFDHTPIPRDSQVETLTIK